MFLLRSPGVYRPQHDTWLLARAARLRFVPPYTRVLDVCTGTGVLALTAAKSGAGRVSAVDVSRRAVWTARANAVLHRSAVRVRRGHLSAPVAGETFDLIVANPPYVVSEGPGPGRGRHRAWDAGADGRCVVDEICRAASTLLAPGGALFILHSSLCGTARTLELLRSQGLNAAVVDRAAEPFGPVMRARLPLLGARGLIDPGQTCEELVVIRADRARPARTRAVPGDGRTADSERSDRGG